MINNIIITFDYNESTIKQYTILNLNTTKKEVVQNYFNYTLKYEGNSVVEDKYVYITDCVYPREEILMTEYGNTLFIKANKWFVNFIDWEELSNYDKARSNYSFDTYLIYKYNNYIHSDIDYKMHEFETDVDFMCINPQNCIADGKGGGGVALVHIIASIFSNPDNIEKLFGLVSDDNSIAMIQELMNAVDKVYYDHNNEYSEIPHLIRYLYEHIKEDLADLPYECIKTAFVYKVINKFKKENSE